MDHFDALVLASDPAGELSQDPHIKLNAHVPIHGKPMLDWVVDSLRQCRYIGKINVVGPDSLDELLCSRYISKRIPPAMATLNNLSGLWNSQSNYFLVIPCEAVYLTSDTIDKSFQSFTKLDTQFAIPCIVPEKVRINTPVAPKVEWKGKKVIPGVISFVRKGATIPLAIHKLKKLERKRDPLGSNKVILPALATLEETLIERSESVFKYFSNSNQQVVMSIRSKRDLEYAKRMLANPWHPRFKKVKVIVNPHSGQGIKLPSPILKFIGLRKRSLDQIQNAKQLTETIRLYLNEIGMYPEFYVSKSSEDATQTARACAKNRYDLVIAAGGDGSINAVINGLAKSEVTFGAIPLGTVNLYALQLQIPMEIRAACQLIAEGNTKKIDLGKAGNKYFTCLSGIGFDAFVIKRADTKLKKILGAAAYILVGITNFFKYSFNPVILYVDNQIVPRKGYSVIIGNGKYYSSNLIIYPDASIEDGLLDVIIFKNRSILSIVNYLRGLRKGHLTEHSDIEYYLGKSIKIDKKGKHHVHIDGEPHGQTPLDISIIPKALNVVF
ncbi:YegS/Rv2252/BmrU family lipid kinase [Chitinispirillales bacterium ANBcel5]|uniref:YegS/Rv2252/BmrU family lipid kinase n=1 Tax=Cellulosispirillum alkaliphilum TaxID=3039283 RepID=UPI002A4F5B3D|nr:YegS/Rv2252/BmrU family lipid kinase [Chitinispirillales bacterium ANBcel5]